MGARSFILKFALGFFSAVALSSCLFQAEESKVDPGFHPGIESGPSGPAPILTLTSVLPTATDDSAAAFASGSSTGVAYSGGALSVGSGGGCDGAITNCAELDASWAPQWSNVIGYWKLNELPGVGVVADSSPLGTNLGTVVGTITQGAAGKLNSAVLFDGSASYVEVPDVAPLRLTSQFTVQAWVKPNTLHNYGNVIFKYSGSPTGGYGIITFADGSWNWQIAGAPDITTPAGSLTNGQWALLTVTSDGSNIRLYENSLLVTTSVASPISPSNHALIIGADDINSRFFNGSIDEVAIWNSGLSGSQIQTIYSRQSPSYGGTYSSRIIDAGSSKSWSNFSWLATLPFGKELPDAGMSESSVDYAALVGSDGTTATHDLMSGNVGLWHLNESIAGTTLSGKDFKDSAGGNHDGTSSGTITYGATAPLHSGIVLDGASASISTDLDVQPSAMPSSTWSAWIKPERINYTNYQQILTNDDGGFDRCLIIVPSSSTYAVMIGNGIWDTGVSIDVNKWTHIVIIFTPTDVLFYKNGIGTSRGIAPAYGSSVNKLNIGTGLNSGHFFKGSFDEVAIWNRALEANEVRQLYQRGSSRLRFQIKSCALSDCSDGSWQGPDGSNQTYFSELNNKSVPLDASGFVLATLPNMLFSAFTSPPSASRYFQYRAIFEADDADVTLGPQLKNVSVRTTASQVLPSYTATGTCSVNGVSVTVTITDGSTSASGSGTCTSGIYTAVVDVSTLSDGNLTITASSTNGGVTGTASGSYYSSNTHLPASATALSWTESSPSTSTTLHANWTPSTSIDLSNQMIQFYTGACASTAGSLINLGSKTAATYAFTQTNAGIYSFKITSVDTAGNSQTSACSSLLTESVFTDNSSSPMTPGFYGASQVGTAWGTASDALTPAIVLNTATNNAELSSSWTPEYSFLIHDYKMNNDWTDSVGTSNGSPQGTIAFIANSRLGSAAAGFDGTAYVQTSQLLSSTDATQAYSIMSWFKTNLASGQYGGLFSQGGFSASVGFSNCCGLFDSINVSYTNAGINIYTHTSVRDGNWHQLILTRASGGLLSTYVDGVPDVTGTFSSAFPVGNFNIGKGYNGVNFSGNLDEFAIWSTALTPIEVATIYSRQSIRYAGTLTSRIMNYGSTDAWTSLKWLTTLPFGKELPDNAVSESSADYSSQTANLMTGNIGLWHFNESGWSGTASEVKDSSSALNNGRARNGANTSSTAMFGRAGKFDGSTSYVEVPTSPALETALAGDLTIAAWIKPNSFANYSGIVSKVNVNLPAPIDFYLTMNSGIPNFLHGDGTGPGGGSSSGTSAPPLNKWSLIAVTFQGSTVAHYINGIPNGGASITSGSSDFGHSLLIGSREDGATYFNGAMDEVSLWNRALSSTEVLELYRRGANRIKFQVRTCTTGDCSDRSLSGDWLGPDNSNQSYFSELHNNSAFTSVGSITNNVLAGFPQMVFANFSGLTIPTRQYFQYHAILESDDTGTACGGSWCSPELRSVTVSP